MSRINFTLRFQAPLGRWMTGTVLALTTIAAAHAQADVKAGVDAWSNGDYDAAVHQWQPLADSGDPDAQFNLAQAYKLGRGVPVDLARAEALYGKAASEGHLQAADAYGLLLFQRGERTRALPYIQASAARGDARAEYLLGIAHFNGDIVTRDWVRAYALVSLAQQAGLPQAASAKAQMDQHISLADRQKSVVAAQQIAAQAQANRQQLNTSAELGLAAAAPAADASVPPVAITRPREVAVSHPIPQASTVPDRRAAAAPAPRTTPALITNAPVKPATGPATGPWRVQLGAFGVPANAEAMWARVRKRPELSGHPKALVHAGKLSKLQATGFISKADADSACSRLSAAGFGCLATRD